MKRIARFALPAVLAVACAILASAGAAATLPDACKLLKRSEAAAVLRLKVQAPDDYGTSCSYVADFNGPSGQLQIFLDTTTPRALRIDRKLRHKFWSVRGIGDQAFEEDWNIFVRKGQVWVYISMIRTDDPKLYRQGLERVARLAVSRLGGRRVQKLAAADHGPGPVIGHTRRWSGREQRFGGSIGRYPGVVYQPNVVLIGGGAGAVQAAIPDGLTWTIAGDAPGVSDLRVGKIMLATTFAAGRVLKLTHVGPNVQVVLGPVPLTDVVRDGEFKSAAPVPLGHPIVVRAALPSRKPHGGGSQFTTQTTCCEGGIGVRIHYDNGNSGRLNAMVQLLVKQPSVSFDIKISLSRLVEAKLTLHGAAALRYDIKGATLNKTGSVQSGPIAVPYTDTLPLSGPLALTLSQAFDVSMQIAGEGALEASGEYAIDGDLGFAFGRGGVTADAVTMATQKAITKNTLSLGVGINSIEIGWKLRATVGIGLVGFSAGGWFAVRSGLALTADETPLSLKHGCTTAALKVSGEAGVGYTIPDYALSVINAFLRFVQAKPIPASGGPSWGPFRIWYPPSAEYCPQSGGRKEATGDRDHQTIGRPSRRHHRGGNSELRPLRGRAAARKGSRDGN